MSKNSTRLQRTTLLATKIAWRRCGYTDSHCWSWCHVLDHRCPYPILDHYTSQSVTEQFDTCAPDWRTSFKRASHNVSWSTSTMTDEWRGCHILVHCHCRCVYGRDWSSVFDHRSRRCVGHGGPCRQWNPQYHRRLHRKLPPR